MGFHLKITATSQFTSDAHGKDSRVSSWCLSCVQDSIAIEEQCLTQTGLCISERPNVHMFSLIAGFSAWYITIDFSGVTGKQIIHTKCTSWIFRLRIWRMQGLRVSQLDQWPPSPSSYPEQSVYLDAVQMFSLMCVILLPSLQIVASAHLRLRSTLLFPPSSWNHFLPESIPHGVVKQMTSGLSYCLLFRPCMQPSQLKMNMIYLEFKVIIHQKCLFCHHLLALKLFQSKPVLFFLIHETQSWNKTKVSTSFQFMGVLFL